MVAPNPFPPAHPPDPQPRSSLRGWLYVVLAGLAIGLGTGLGQLISSDDPPAPRGELVHGTAAPAPSRTARDAPAAPTPSRTAGDAPGAVPAPPEPAVEPTAPGPVPGVNLLIAAQHAAIASVDREGLAEELAPMVFGFGVAAGEVAEGRAAVVAQLVDDLGPAPAAGFTVQSTSIAIGEQQGHAWIAEELEVAADGAPPRRFAVSELAALIDGRWQIVALHWATPIDDATAERLATRHRLPVPAPIADRHDDGELDRAIRAAFSSRAAFVAARSERGDAFNFGSGGERARGGVAIKRLFTKLKAQIGLRGGARVVAGSAWDPAQRGESWIGWAAVNIDFASHGRTGIELPQTFRVLAIAIKEAGEWKLVQTQWSNGGSGH